MELQRIESERAKVRQLSGLNNQEPVRLNSNEREGNSLDHVAAALGISRDRWYKLKTVFERADLRKKATQFGSEEDAVGLNSDPPGKSLDHVAAALGISRKTAHFPRERENPSPEPLPAKKPARYSHAEPLSFGNRCKYSSFGPDCSRRALNALSVEMC